MGCWSCRGDGRRVARDQLRFRASVPKQGAVEVWASAGVAVIDRALLNQAARTVLAMRSSRSRQYLRGFAAGVREADHARQSECPYPEASASADAFWAGQGAGWQFVERKEQVAESIRKAKEAQANLGKAELVSSRRGTSFYPGPLTTEGEAVDQGERHMFVWSSDEVEFAIDAYKIDQASIEVIANSLNRTPNAVVWKLWQTAGGDHPLKALMVKHGDVLPRKHGDLRTGAVAFNWVVEHLRGAIAQLLRSGEEVSLEVLYKRASGVLDAWPPTFGGDEARIVERRAARKLFSDRGAWPGTAGFSASSNSVK